MLALDADEDTTDPILVLVELATDRSRPARCLRHQERTRHAGNDLLHRRPAQRRQGQGPMTTFISYSGDRALRVELVYALSDHGVTPWRDVENLDAGDRTTDTIEAELADCSGVILG